MKVIANKRNAQGTGASRRLRNLGKVPGILYGAGTEPVNIELDHNPLFHSLRREKFHASILELDLDGRNERVLLRDFQMHPYRSLVLHVDFQRVAEDQKIHMRVPLHFVGAENSPAVKLSAAIIGHVLSEVEIACLPRDLPEFIEVDLSGLTAQQTVHVSDLKLPQGVSVALRGKEDPVVVTVALPSVQQEEAAPVAEAAAAPAAPAAAAPGAKAAAPPAGGKAAPAAKAAAAPAAPAAKAPPAKKK
ncbi:50S ribosomal protein L25 [Burkholderiales bacterium]|nr:50S ribosomal protein L25 [Burkholderiales bacterium]